MDKPRPRSADIVSPHELRIEWDDGVVSRLGARRLRLACPCAHCVEEGTGVRVLRDEDVREDVTLLKAELVGRYALNFTWSDGHATGIFAWDYLRHLSEGGAGKGVR